MVQELIDVLATTFWMVIGIAVLVTWMSLTGGAH